VTVFFYHLLFLVKASQVYKAISLYSENGISAIQKVPLAKEIVVKHLPVYSNGLPIFNYGFFNAVVWLAPGRDSTSVTIIDKKVFRKQKIVVIRDSSAGAADTITFTTP